MKHWIIRPVFCAALLMFIALPALAQPPAGTIERQKGQASRTQQGSPLPLSKGADVFAGDILKTGKDARLLVRFADGSSLTLGGDADR